MKDDTERGARSRPEAGAGSIDDAIAALDVSLRRLRSQLSGLRASSDLPASTERGPSSASPPAPHGGSAYSPPPHVYVAPDPPAGGAADPLADANVGRTGQGVPGPAEGWEPPDPPRSAGPDEPSQDEADVLSRARSLARELVDVLDALADRTSPATAAGTGTPADTPDDAATGMHGGLPQLSSPGAGAGVPRTEMVEVGPIESVAALHDFEAKLGRLPYLDDIHLRVLSGSRAKFDLRLSGALSLEDELPHVLGPGYVCERGPGGGIQVQVGGERHGHGAGR